MENKDLATELLHELKASSKRWFIAFCIMVVLEVITIFGFMWYITLPTEETTITQESDEDSYNQVIGGDYNGEQTENNTQEESNEK